MDNYYNHTCICVYACRLMCDLCMSVCTCVCFAHVCACMNVYVCMYLHIHVFVCGCAHYITQGKMASLKVSLNSFIDHAVI